MMCRLAVTFCPARRSQFGSQLLLPTGVSASFDRTCLLLSNTASCIHYQEFQNASGQDTTL